MSIVDILDTFFLFALALARMLAVFAMIPIFSAQVLPGAARTATAASMVLMVFPALGALDAGRISELPVLVIMGLVAKEVFIGIAIGFGISTIFWALETTGFLIDNQRGSTMASSVDPLTGSQTSPLGIFLTQVITVYFMVSGGFLLLLFAIYESYILFPILSFYPSLELESVTVFLSILGRIMALGVLMAAPAMIAMFLAEFGLGLVSRFAPQLNVFFLAMPVKSAVGILMLILYIGLLEIVWEGEFARMIDHIGVLRGLLQ